MTTATVHVPPAPGTRYPFSISDAAHHAAALLPGWSAIEGSFGTSGTLTSPNDCDFLLDVEEGHLRLWFEDEEDYPSYPPLPDGVRWDIGGVCLCDVPEDTVEAMAEFVAAAIRTVTGMPRP